MSDSLPLLLSICSDLDKLSKDPLALCDELNLLDRPEIKDSKLKGKLKRNETKLKEYGLGLRGVFPTIVDETIFIQSLAIIKEKQRSNPSFYPALRHLNRGIGLQIFDIAYNLGILRDSLAKGLFSYQLQLGRFSMTHEETQLKKFLELHSKGLARLYCISNLYPPNSYKRLLDRLVRISNQSAQDLQFEVARLKSDYLYLAEVQNRDSLSYSSIMCNILNAIIHASLSLRGSEEALLLDNLVNELRGDSAIESSDLHTLPVS